MSELLVFGDDDVMKEGAEWPVEVVGSGAVGGEVTLYSRESCKLLATEERAWPESGDSELPGREQRRCDKRAPGSAWGGACGYNLSHDQLSSVDHAAIQKL